MIYILKSVIILALFNLWGEYIMKEQLIINGKNEIVENFEFEKVDFNSPSTMVNYGQDVISAIERTVADATNGMKQEQIIDQDFRERVDKLSGFSDTLDLVEEKRQKSEKGINRIFKYIRQNILREDVNASLSYSEAYKEYTSNVDLVADDVALLYGNSKQDFELFNNFIEKIKPYTMVLQSVYNQGVIDKDAFEQEVIELEKSQTLNPNDQDLRREAIIKRQYLDYFTERLYSIQKAQTTINETVIEWNMRQINALKMLGSYQSFLSLDKSILKLNGTALVGAKKQKEEAEQLTYLINGMNDALKEGAREATEVISSVNELTKDGNIRIDTLTEVDKYIQEGIKLLKEGSIEKKAFIESSSKQLEAITEHFKQFNLEIKEQVLLDAYDKVEMVNPPSTKNKTKQKRK